jgi:plasmid stability protein
MVNQIMPRGLLVARKTKPNTAHDLDRIIVRLPDGMRDQIAQLAEANGRSMTAEVVAALEQHLKGPDRISAIEAFIERHRESIETLDQLWTSIDRLERMVRIHEENIGQ